MTGVEFVDRVRQRLAGSSTSPDLGLVVRDEQASASVIADEAALATIERDVAAEVAGAGPLEPLLAMPSVSDVLVNGPREVWLDRGRGLERSAVTFADDAAVRRLAQRLAAAAGRRLDDASPFVDAALPDGTRLHAVLPPITARTTLSLRVLARRRFELRDLVEARVATLLRAIVAARLTLVISGGTGSGKTTLLGALLGCVPASERLVVIEDAAELVTGHPHLVRLVTRTANVEGAGAIGLRELVRQALRMRPDRLVVGEFRGAEIVDLLVALNTGHEGGAATLHANAAVDVPARLYALGGLGGLSSAAVTSQVASALDVVVHLRRARSGLRGVAEIAMLERRGDGLVVAPVWSSERGVQARAHDLVDRLLQRGVDPGGLLQ
ncbi:MAG TPA: TadA family conjugal transfer-associated ATPase [Jatrophihabitantaceae bacterium]